MSAVDKITNAVVMAQVPQTGPAIASLGKDNKSTKEDVAEEGAKQLNSEMALTIQTENLAAKKDEPVRTRSPDHQPVRTVTPDQPITSDLKELADRLTPIKHLKADIHERTVAKRNRARENGMTYAQASAAAASFAGSASAAAASAAETSAGEADAPAGEAGNDEFGDISDEDLRGGAGQPHALYPQH
jgi:hypothetical protein